MKLGLKRFGGSGRRWEWRMALAAMGVRRATGAVRLYRDAANLSGFIYDPTSGRFLACKPSQPGELSEPANHLGRPSLFWACQPTRANDQSHPPDGLPRYRVWWPGAAFNIVDGLSWGNITNNLHHRMWCDRVSKVSRGAKRYWPVNRTRLNTCPRSRPKSVSIHIPTRLITMKLSDVEFWIFFFPKCAVFVFFSPYAVTLRVCVQWQVRLSMTETLCGRCILFWELYKWLGTTAWWRA